MKILIVSQYYFPEQFQINEIAPELVKRGHEVTVLCGIPNYPKGDVFPGYENKESIKKKEAEYYKKTGVRVIHVEQILRGHNPISLALNYYSFAKNSKKMVSYFEGDFDIVMGYQLSPIFSMNAAIEYKRLHNVPLLYYVLDLWPVSAKRMLHGDINPLYGWLRKASAKIYNAADSILVTSNPFVKYLSNECGVPTDKMGYLPQHADLGMMKQDLSSEDNGVADFMFAGNIGTFQDIETIVNATAILGARKDYHIHLVGDGASKKKIELMVEKAGLKDNYTFYGNQKREDMPKFYKKADALLITLKGDNETGSTMPGKLQMYMTIGKPIFGAINGAANEVVSEALCGSCVNAGDAEGLAKLMEFFIEHPESYSECGANARRYFTEQFTLEIFMDQLEKEIKKLLK